MKHLSSWRALVLLVAPVLLLVVLIAGPAELGWSQYTGPVGTIVVGFTGHLPKKFQNVAFNVVSVRLNPSTNPSVSEYDPNWVTIPVPPGVGLNTSSVSNPFLNLATLYSLNTTGASPGAAGTGTSELQIDMGQVAVLPQLFNSWTVPASTYRQIELVLDSANAGTVIPDCTVHPDEGCISSQIAMFNPNPVLSTSAQVTVPLGGIATLVIDIKPEANGKPQKPAYSGANYTLGPGISVPSSADSVMGLVTGQALGATQVLAELSGTDQVVETTTLGGGYYTLVLPAAADGTYYNLVASGPGHEYRVARNVLVQRNSKQHVKLNSTSTGRGSLSGKVTDGCSGAAIQGATLKLVEPAPGTSNDCSKVPTPENCVVLATANTDDTGTYPMPPSNYVNESFTKVADGTYTMVASAAGYTTKTSSISVGGKTVADFSLGRAQINGLVTLSPPLPAGATAALNVLVTAEDHGTHHIENVALATVPPGSSSAPFSMLVPDSSQVGSLDMYASVSDLFGGLPEKYTGHTIAVLSGVKNAGACATNSDNPILTMDCAGHASVIGTTPTFDSGTSVVLSKDGVQLMTSEVLPGATPDPSSTATPIPGRFSFCASADTKPYTLQRYEIPSPGATPSPAAAPTSVTMNPPLTISQPCSSICNNGSGECLVCRNEKNITVP